MNIAYISYEYPPETAFGGIGTYIYQAAKMLSKRGHHVEVFCGSLTGNSISEDGQVKVHRIKSGIKAFAINVLDTFSERHAIINFNLIESPEYHADGIEIFKKYPEVPSIVKTHTPTYLINLINPQPKLELRNYLRVVLGAIRRGIHPFPKIKYEKKDDIEYEVASLARYISTPSKALGEIIERDWLIDKKKILLQPYPFTPKKELTDISICETPYKQVTFIGRLEMRKGLVDLCKAIPKVLQMDPEVTFHFIGKAMHSPNPKYNMEEYLHIKLKKYDKSLKFYGVLNIDQMVEILSNTAICIFPSVWEAFGYVCLEAMSAGRAVIGSNAGGMAEILSEDTGVLIPPNNPDLIAKEIILLLKNENGRMALGRNAREKVLRNYNADKIGQLMEAQYNFVINDYKVE